MEEELGKMLEELGKIMTAMFLGIVVIIVFLLLFLVIGYLLRAWNIRFGGKEVKEFEEEEGVEIRDRLMEIYKYMGKLGNSDDGEINKGRVRETLRRIEELLIYEKTGWEGVELKFYKYRDSIKVMNEMIKISEGLSNKGKTIGGVIGLIGVMYKDIIGESMDDLLYKEITKESNIVKDINKLKERG